MTYQKGDEVSTDTFWQRMKDHHEAEVINGHHDRDCEWSIEENFYLCNCSKRYRERNGKTELPTLSIQYPICNGCFEEVYHNGDCFECSNCNVIWGDGQCDGDEASEFTDDHGDLTRCEPHGHRGCWHCQRKATP